MYPRDGPSGSSTRAQPARQQRDPAGRDLHDAQLGDEASAAHLRHDQHLAIGVVEIAVGHRRVGDIGMGRHAGLRADIAAAAEGADAVDEIPSAHRGSDRAQRSWDGVASVSVRGSAPEPFGCADRPMHHGGRVR